MDCYDHASLFVIFPQRFNVNQQRCPLLLFFINHTAYFIGVQGAKQTDHTVICAVYGKFTDILEKY